MGKIKAFKGIKGALKWEYPKMTNYMRNQRTITK